MANIPSTNSKIQIEETTFRAPVSETLTQRMGGSINYALDQVASNTSGLAAETAARIAADNAIKAQTVVRRVQLGNATLAFNSDALAGEGELMETQTINLVPVAGADNWLLLQIRAETSSTSGRAPSYVDVDFQNDVSFGNQTLFDFTEIGGSHFGTVLKVDDYTSPLVVRFRQFAGTGGGTFGAQRWKWVFSLKFITVNSSALVGP